MSNLPYSALSSTAQYLKTRDYSVIYKWSTLLAAFALTALYIHIMKGEFNPLNPLSSTANVIHVLAAIGITLAMIATPDKSIMRIVQLITMLLIANLG